AEKKSDGKNIPDISILTPVSNQEFTSDESIELMVFFKGSDEHVAKVSYYSGDRLIGTSTISPFTFLWENPSTTKHILIAKAFGEDAGNYKVELVEFENEVKIVEYILENKKIGESKENPYSIQWENIPEGDHRIVARATDIKGKSYYSEPVLFSAVKDMASPRVEYESGPNPTTDYL
ncbi:Ig-like domain-containing protein, partial [Campylobacter fetus subsp. venerealis]